MYYETNKAGDFAGLFIALAVVIGLAATVIYQVTAIPVVQMNYITKECRAVIPESAGSCDNMPTRYTPQWVE